MAGKPGTLPTDQEYEDRLNFTRGLVAEGHHKHVIKQSLKKAYGVCASTCETYISRARELILSETGRPKPEHIAEAYVFLTGVKATSAFPIGERVKAQLGINKLLGLNAPDRLAMTDPTGEKEAAVTIVLPENFRDRPKEQPE